MTQKRLDADALLGIAAHNHHGQMRGAVGAAAGPSLVLLETGVQALVEIAGFTYVDGIPVAVGRGLTEDIDARHWVKASADGVNLELVLAPIGGGAVCGRHG